MNIGLTLSGGGFRASLFHLGVIQYLRSTGLLTNVTQITSVSGGSITAAHVAVNWDRYSGTNTQFEEVSKELIAFTQLGVREHIIAWLPIVALVGRWLPQRVRIDQSTMLSAMYSRYLFKGKAIDALSSHVGTPRVNLAATNLSRPDNLVTFCGDGVYLHGDGGTFVDSQIIDVAHAVSASSAFPLLFPAIGIDTKMLGAKTNQLTPSPQYLSDGGIFDNYGLRALRELREGEPPFDLLVVSDAGARADWLPNTSFNSISLLSRASAISGQRVSDLELSSARSAGLALKIVIVSIHQEVPKETDDNLSPDLQRQLGTVRTDFDAFSNLLVHCLGSHGFAVARHAIANEGIELPQGTSAYWNPLSPNNPTTSNRQTDTKILQGEAFHRWRLFSLKEWRPLLLYAILLGLAYWFLPSLIASGIDRINELVHEFQRSSWTGDDLEITTVKFGDQAFLGTLVDSLSEHDKDKFRMDRWFRWINDGIRPRTRREQVVVVESPLFDGYYREFTLSILSDRNVRVAEGVAFLVHNDGTVSSYRPVYRQMQMRFEPSGENPPELKVASPNKGERLLVILRAVSRSDDPAAVLPSSPSSFSIRLRVQ